MRNLHRVVWAKGMLLTPQHFQAHSNYIEDSLQFRFAASNFANWGVTELSCDEDGLANGEFTVTRFHGVLADGTLVDCPGTDPAPPRRPFGTNFGQAQDSLDVFLAVPDRVEGQNVHLDPGVEASANVRYIARVKDIRDENGLDEDKSVQFARRNLAVLFGNQKMEGYVRLRIAQVVRTSTGFALNHDFVPPLLNVAASKTLMNLIKRQVEILGTKCQALSDARRQRGGAAGFNLSEAQSFWLLQTVNSFLPELTHVWNVRRGHPEPLYVSMLRLAGALATLSEDDVRTLPQYDHDNLGPCFAALDARIRNLLETAIPSKCISIPLKQKQRIWTGAIADDGWVKNSQMYLAVSAEMGADDVIRKVPQLVRVAPPEEIDNIIKFATPGLTLRHLAPPGALPFRVENQYFSVNQAGRLWEGIVRSRTISLFLPPELAGARPELFVLLP